MLTTKHKCYHIAWKWAEMFTHAHKWLLLIIFLPRTWNFRALFSCYSILCITDINVDPFPYISQLSLNQVFLDSWSWTGSLVAFYLSLYLTQKSFSHKPPNTSQHTHILSSSGCLQLTSPRQEASQELEIADIRNFRSWATSGLSGGHDRIKGEETEGQGVGTGRILCIWESWIQDITSNGLEL